VSQMTCRRLEWLLRARGTEISSWPEADRAAALALLRTEPAARRALADAVALEDAPETDPAVLCRMQRCFRVALMPASAVVRSMGWSALAACIGAGLYIGIGATEPDNSQDLFSDAQTVTFAALDQ
jgi:hypothetical protein